MAVDPRTTRGALAGAVAAAVWAVQQPLDRRLFAVDYDDTELLGKLVTRRPAWRPIGLALHLVNGAGFGAVYARAPRRGPLPPWARGPAAALTECVATWPLLAVSDRIHPARHQLPTLGGNGRAFAQAVWRHLLFGTVMGELERRLNRPAAEPPEATDGPNPSTNGHGDLAETIVVARA
jgi:hypothetical protein